MNNNWIPVTERLPEISILESVKSGSSRDNGEDYLVTYDDGEVWITTFWAKAKRFADYHDRVIAWMPLPESYKPEDDRS